MLKTLKAQIGEFARDSILTPLCMIGEVIMEMIIPLMMASIIDDGVEKGDIHHIYVVGAWMILAAALGLFFGVMGGALRGPGRHRLCPQPAPGHVPEHPDLQFFQY